MGRVDKGQEWSAERYARNSGFIVKFGEGLIDQLAPRRNELVLDLGCGNGALTEKIIARGAKVVGIDSSCDMVTAARERGLDARVMDARELKFDKCFDAVFSHAALHWVKEADVVLAGVRRALMPGGRFVVDMGGAGNIAHEISALSSALRRRGYDPSHGNPWYFPTVEQHKSLLLMHDFKIDEINLFKRPTIIDGELSEWLDTFAESYLSLVSPAEREGVKAEVISSLRPSLTNDIGQWTLDYVRLRFIAHV